MTERLYYTDAYRTAFEGRVVRCVPRPEADGTPRFAVELDTTAFYPTSGGQPFDLGTVAEARVLDVVDEQDGRITHVTDGPVAEGGTARGTIDWVRRFDHMQQHTGQHILSAAFDRLFANRTESFHLGAESCTIDLGREMSARDVAAAVDEANRIVWEDRPVSVRFVTAAEAATLPLRKEPAREGTLRLIEIEDFDLSACGGTHVARTGAVGIVAVPGVERFKGGSRVQFLCGGRVRRRFDAWRDALASTQKHLSVSPDELAAAIERLQEENKGLQRTLRGAQEKLAVHEAGALVARGQRAGDRLVVVESIPDLDAVGLKAMAAAAAAHPGAAVVLFSASTPSLVVVAAHPAAGVDANATLKTLVARFGGKGGGKPELAQGGGLVGDSAALLAAARELLRARKREGTTAQECLRVFRVLSTRRHAKRAVETDHLAVEHLVLDDVPDERAVLGGPTQSRREGHLLSERDPRGFRQRREERCVEDARRNRHAPDADRRELPRHRQGEADDAALRGRIGRLADLTVEGRDRRGVDDHAALARFERRGSRSSRPRRAGSR